MDKEMIERCCRAAHTAAVSKGAKVPTDYDDPRITKDMKAQLKYVTLAVIKAMREPTEKMQLAAMLTCVYENKGIEYSPSLGWKAMIDAVIDE